MRQLIKYFLNRIPYVHNLRQQIITLEGQIEKQGRFPAGHYYSPIPDRDQILAYFKSRRPPTIELPDVELNKERQFKVLSEYLQFYREFPFPKKQTPEYRYYYDNGWYPYADAVFLYCFLRKLQPKRIIEIGSGFSSAVMLDTVDGFFSHWPDITFIEPYPDRLVSLLRNDDKEKVRIIDKRIQDVPSAVLFSLNAGDLLFIDSSHVLKCGSDLQLLIFETLPVLAPGVFVHFHDVFYPFDYPSEWLTMGRYWNESYFLRAFLSYNFEWNVYFFNAYVAFAFNDFIKNKMPLCLSDPGTSLYIERVKHR